MNNLGFVEMQEMQKELQDKYKDKWEAITPETGKNKLLWLVAELGEVADIIKKEGERKIVEEKSVRTHFVEELCDVLMYFNDIMLCYGITVDEFKEEYLKKHEKNMTRW